MEVGQFIGRENSHLTEVVTLMDGEWSYYRCGHFNGRKENGFFTEVACLMAGRFVMLERWSSLMEGEWFMLQKRWPL